MKNIDIQQLVQLKERGLSDRKISNLLEEQGIKISSATINKKLNIYYNSIGKAKPKAVRKDKLDIPIEQLIELKKQNLSDKKIADLLSNGKRKISMTKVNKLLRAYYQSIEEKKPRARTYTDIEKLVQLKEQGMSDRKISDILSNEGINVSIEVINSMLRKYYKEIKRTKPRARIPVDIDEILSLQKKGLSIDRIEKEYANRGIKISASTISRRLLEEKKVNPNYNTSHKKDNIQIGRPNVEYDDIIKQILMHGITIDEFIRETGTEEKRESIETKLRKLEFLSWYSEINNRTMERRL